MLDGISVIASEPKLAENIRAALSGSGLTVWEPLAVDGFAADSKWKDALCLIVDVPGTAGIECLIGLRKQGVRTPAILVADDDCAISAEQLAAVSILDVLKRPAGKRELLAWIECVCTAHVALDRYRSSRKFPVTPPPARTSPFQTHIR